MARSHVPATPARHAADDDVFRRALGQLIHAAQDSGAASVRVRSGDLHRTVGGYPGPGHRMPACCAAMRAEMTSRRCGRRGASERFRRPTCLSYDPSSAAKVTESQFPERVLALGRKPDRSSLTTLNGIAAQRMLFNAYLLADYSGAKARVGQRNAIRLAHAEDLQPPVILTERLTRAELVVGIPEQPS